MKWNVSFSWNFREYLVKKGSLNVMNVLKIMNESHFEEGGKKDKVLFLSRDLLEKLFIIVLGYYESRSESYRQDL